MIAIRIVLAFVITVIAFALAYTSPWHVLMFVGAMEAGDACRDIARSRGSS